MGVSVLVLAVFLQLVGGMVARDVYFDENYGVVWGKPDHVETWYRGRELVLFLDQASGASFVSKQWFGSGFFHMRIKLPRGNSAGVVTTFYLTSGDGDGVKDRAHDELDFEFLGNIKGEPILLQTNVFANGTGGREQRITLWFDPTTEYHDYKILWNHNQIVFYVDDIPIRVFKKLRKSGVPFPSQPMQIQASLWHAKWASQNETDWTYAPFKAHYQGFDISGCPCATKQCMIECYGQNYWWNDIRELNSDQRRAYDDVRRRHMHYDYCAGPNTPAPECSFNS
ncbi:hypothetical protein ACE6H2_028101 [Prunus campanulata]